jgi:hypothetical protein
MLVYLHQPPTGRCGTPPRAWTLHPPMKRQRSLKVELVVSSPCQQIRGPRAAGDGARFTFQLALPAGISVRTDQLAHCLPIAPSRAKGARGAFARWYYSVRP